MEFLTGEIYKVTFGKGKYSYIRNLTEYIEYSVNRPGGYKINKFNGNLAYILITGSNSTYISFMYNGKDCYNYRDVGIFNNEVNNFELIG